MRRGHLHTRVSGLPCVVEYLYSDPLPATDVDPPCPAEIELVQVTDEGGHRIRWIESELVGDAWDEIRDRINDQEQP